MNIYSYGINVERLKVQIDFPRATNAEIKTGVDHYNLMVDLWTREYTLPLQEKMKINELD